MKLLFFTDPHNSDTPPRMREDSYFEDILAKQEEVAKLSKKHDVTLCGGDIFHQKRSDKISFKLVNRLCEIFREMGPTVIVPGNHDVETKWDFSVRPLGILSHLPNVKLSHADITQFDEFVLLTFGGAEFFHELEFEAWLDAVHVTMIKKRIKKFKIGVFHQAIRAHEWDESSFPFPLISPNKVELLTDMAFIGHIHRMLYMGQKLIYPGALSRGVLSADEVERDIYVVSAEIRGNEMERSFVSIPHKDGIDVFKIVEKAKEKGAEKEVGEFLSFIETLDLPKTLDSEDIITTIEGNKELDNKVAKKAVQILRGL